MATQERREPQPLPQDPELWEKVRLLRGARLARAEMAKRAEEAMRASSPMIVRVEQPGGRGVCRTYVEFDAPKWTRQMYEQLFPDRPPPVGFECMTCGYAIEAEDEPEKCAVCGDDGFHELDVDRLRKVLRRNAKRPPVKPPDPVPYECVECEIITDFVGPPEDCPECGCPHMRTPPLNLWLGETPND